VAHAEGGRIELQFLMKPFTDLTDRVHYIPATPSETPVRPSQSYARRDVGIEVTLAMWEKLELRSQNETVRKVMLACCSLRGLP
jgi:hypothetical protein